MARAPRTSLSSMLVDAQRWLPAAERANSGRATGLARSHSLVFAHLDADGTRPAEIARRAGISRQAVGQTVAQMKTQGLVKLAPDPSNRRATRLALGLQERQIGCAVVETEGQVGGGSLPLRKLA